MDQHVVKNVSQFTQTLDLGKNKSVHLAPNESIELTQAEFESSEIRGKLRVKVLRDVTPQA